MMKHIFRIFSMVVCLGSSLAAMAQTPVVDTTSYGRRPDSLSDQIFYVQMVARNYGDSIVLRWAPEDAGVWRLGTYEGYIIERLGGTKLYEDNAAILTLNGGKPIKPLTLEQIQARYSSDDLHAGALAQMLYGPSMVDTMGSTTTEGFLGNIFHQYQEQGQRQLMVYILSDMRADLAQAGGLRFVDRDIERGQRYEYSIHPIVDTSFINVAGSSLLVSGKAFKRTADFEVPTINIEQIDASRAVLYWGRNSLTGYFIECSIDGGAWTKVNETPIFATNPDEETRQVYGEELSKLMKDNVVYIDSLKLGHTYRFRVKGYDAFADYSDFNTMEHAFKMIDIVPPSSPIILSTTPSADNSTCTLEWVKDTLEGDFRGYVVTFSFSSQGPWHNVSNLLDPKTTSYTDYNAGERGPGYYRIFASDTAGNASFSLAAGNNIADLVAPHAPTNLRGQSDFIFDTIPTPAGDSLAISTNGQIYLEWDPVNDFDLLGYRVFYANQRDHDYIEASHKPTTNLFFFDTVNIKTITPYIYYYVIAVDQRYNYSIPSDTIAIRTPDIVPPGVCVLLDMHQTDDSVYITWTKSTSEDVQQYIVYRRQKGSNRWVHNKTIPAAQLEGKTEINFVDCPPANNRAYQYCIEALDSAMLSSGRFGYVNVYSKGPRIAEVKMNLNAKRDKKTNRVNLNWKYNYRGELAHYGVIYRAIDGGAYTAIASFNEGTFEYVDTQAPAGSTLKYYIVLKLGNGCTSNPSNTVSVK